MTAGDTGDIPVPPAPPDGYLTCGPWCVNATWADGGLGVFTVYPTLAEALEHYFFLQRLGPQGVVPPTFAGIYDGRWECILCYVSGDQGMFMDNHGIVMTHEVGRALIELGLEEQPGAVATILGTIARDLSVDDLQAMWQS